MVAKPEVEPPSPCGEVRLHGTNQHQRGSQLDVIIASSGLLAMNLPLLPRRLQLAVALRVDLLLPPRQHVLRRMVARGAVQSDVVVVVHASAYQTPCIIERQRRSWPRCRCYVTAAAGCRGNGVWQHNYWNAISLGSGGPRFNRWSRLDEVPGHIP